MEYVCGRSGACLDWELLGLVHTGDKIDFDFVASVYEALG